ncbi:MAG TPA: type II toxin-antitoxin system VapC family toxin [Candidatus Angelobacter sp.]
MLLDTHALLWYLTDDKQLPKEIRDQISRQNLVYVSAAVIWEIAIKGSLGKLEYGVKPITSRRVMDEIVAECVSQEFQFLDISPSHASQAPFFVSDHKDPFDRLLAAQAIQQGMILVSRDAAFDGFSPNIRRLWAGTSAPATAPPKKRAAKATKKVP